MINDDGPELGGRHHQGIVPHVTVCGMDGAVGAGSVPITLRERKGLGYVR